VIYPYLKALVLRQRREQAERRRLETDRQRAERQAEVEQLRAERIQLKEEARQVRQDQVRDGMERGLTNREIVADLGVSMGTVEKLKREVRGGAPWDRNGEERAARLGRASKALGLQGQGLSRAEIGQRMSLSEATVKMLLRDAKPACAAGPTERGGTPCRSNLVWSPTLDLST
jgi:DNA-binding NarL/FixJ family response regulator